MTGRVAVALLALAAAGAGGCGYSLRGTLPPHIQTVAVTMLRNRTAEPAIDQVLTRAIADAFATNGRLRVTTPAEADAVLEGEVVGYEVRAIAFDRQANVEQYRLLVTLDLRLRDVRANRLLFEQRGVQERADFLVPATVAETIAREQAALRVAATDIARAVVSRAVEQF